MPISGYRVKAVLFDFDGTLTQPGALDFKFIKKALGCPSDQPVLEFIQSIAGAHERRKAMEKLDRFELDGAVRSRPNAGAQEIVAWVKAHNLSVGIITRNSRDSVITSLANFDMIASDDFDVIISRDDPLDPKPSGDGILWAARQLKIQPNEMLVVGDFIFDPQAGKAAGALTALLDPDNDTRLQSTACDFRIRNLDELKTVIRSGLPLPAGKLPNHLLQRFLEKIKSEDPSVLIYPAVGEDVTATVPGKDQLVVLKSDPITFATDAIGRYAVAVNANDIATAGATPRWFLTTLLLPYGITPSQVNEIMQELAQEARRWEVTLCGGHTEITDAVHRPVVSGMMVGTVKPQDLIEKKNMRKGDVVLLTKGVAVEGTAIIAREFKERLLAFGITAEEINRCRRWIDRISILPEARLAAGDGAATAMHDVTEGGLATALLELSVAGGRKIAVELEKIPVYDQTQRMCEVLGLEPLGLIGSGSLLICCPAERCDALMRKIENGGIAVACIGKILGVGEGIEASYRGKPVPWPEFKVDEITRLFR
ncbi:MAG: HAD hydrolase-like protein [Desulfobacteraceae bacterium]